ncbi:hypothetical protein EDD11_009549 [Mortierella claussenii]|nr:hypothetical protein EDD11_009549 [Mortierella claussenii]
MISSHDIIPTSTLTIKVRQTAVQLNEWLETAKSTVLGLGVEVKQERAGDRQDVTDIDMIMKRFQPNIEMMMELHEKIGPRLAFEQTDADQQQESIGMEGSPLTEPELQRTINAIHSNWVSLKTTLDEVKGICATALHRREILTRMEDVLAEIEQIGLDIDQFKEEKARQSLEVSSPPASSPSPAFLLPSLSLDTATSSEDVQGKQKNTGALSALYARIESLTPRINALTTQIEELPSQDAARDELQDQYRELLGFWDETKTRRERLGEELKEERWLTVFEQVAGQVESMMESMERAIVHCKGLVDQIKGMVKEKVVPTAPIDRDHLYTIFKSFESKHKYYAPAVNKMLNMLENGIESRATKNTEVMMKQQIMKTKWDHLQASLDGVELDLDSIKEMLDMLDASIPSSHLPAPPAQLPEKPLFAMRRSQTSAEWRSPGPPALFQPPQQSQQQQRGRRPLPSSSPLPFSAQLPQESSTMRSRSPFNAQFPRRSSSPASSISSTSLLSPNMYTSTRSLSRSPSRSPSRANSDKLRPWCPSTKTTSPSIPGIPHAPSTAATYTPRSTSSTRQGRDASPSRPPLSRSSSVMSRTRSTSCTPSLNGSGSGSGSATSQLRPTFSSAGSMNKLSIGLQPNSRSASPTPRPMPATTSATKATIGSVNGGRKPQSKLPPPVVTNVGSRFRQNSAPGTPTPQPRRSSSPIPYRGTSYQDTAAPSSSASSFTNPRQQQQQGQTFPPPVTRQRQPSGRSISQLGYRSDHFEGEADATNQRRRRPSLGNHNNLPGSKDTSSIYGASGLGQNAGSASSMGLEICAVPPFEEPTSPSTSSSSSVGSFSRPQPSLRSQSSYQPQQQQQQQQQQEQRQQLQQKKSIVQDLMQETRPYIPTRGDELDEEFARTLNASLVRLQVRKLGEGKYYFGGRMEVRGPGKIVAVGGKMVLCRLMEYGRAGASHNNTEEDSGVSSGGSHSGVEEAVSQQQQRSRSRSRGAPHPPPVAAAKTLRRPEPAAGRSTRSRASSFNAQTTFSPLSSGGAIRNRKVMVRVGGGWQDLDLYLLGFSC